MKFEYTKSCNIREEQVLYGIVADTVTTYGGVYELKVYEIDWNEEEIIFECKLQPCVYLVCRFDDMSRLLFETREEAEDNINSLDYQDGVQSYCFS